MEPMANNKSRPRKTAYRLLIWLGVFLIVLAAVFRTIKTIRTNRELAGIDAPGLVRAVRQSENWIHDVNSLLIRVNSTWTKTPEGIAAYRKELKQQYPNKKIDPNRDWGLKSGFTDSLEFAVRQKPGEKKCLRLLRDTPGRMRLLEIFSGKEHFSYNKYFTPPNEFYLINDANNIACELFLDMSWPRAQAHVFWSAPISNEQMLNEWGPAEGFACVGREAYRGVDCYVLECEPPAFRGRVRRWYVGIKDCLLYGNMLLDSGGGKTFEYWTLDYKEVAPGCWYPMTQGCELYNRKWLTVYQDSRRDLKVTEVRVNEQLPDELFEMQFEPGVRVIDERINPSPINSSAAEQH